MTQLHEIIAVEPDVRKAYSTAVTGAYHRLQKPQPLHGISRTYQPDLEDGERLPEEKTRVQYTVRKAIGDVEEHLARMFDVVATKDQANQKARADVIVDGHSILEAVPATHLLFLEKQLTDLATLIKSFPTLDPAESWNWNENLGVYASEPVKTARTKKIPRNHVLAPATERHPAQVEMYHEDQKVGEWSTTKFSGAYPETVVRAMLDRVRTLQKAVKQARMRANAGEVQRVNGEGAVILRYVFDNQLPG